MVSAAANSVNHSLALRCETPAGLLQIVLNCRTSQRRLCRHRIFRKNQESDNDNQKSREDGASTRLVTESLIARRSLQALSGSTFETWTLRRFSYYQFGYDQ